MNRLLRFEHWLGCCHRLPGSKSMRAGRASVPADQAGARNPKDTIGTDGQRPMGTLVMRMNFKIDLFAIAAERLNPVPESLHHAYQEIRVSL